MKHEGSLQCSQECGTGSNFCPELEKFAYDSLAC